MTHWTDGPIAGFDTETTGTDMEKDRIVTACVSLKSPEFLSESWLINPGVPIPETAAQVHGITDAMVINGLRPVEALKEIDRSLQSAWWQGAPVIIYNAPFDLTMLDRELRRHLGHPLEVSGLVIDPLVLDKTVDKYRAHLKDCASKVKPGSECDCGNSRKLADVCAHYGVTLTEEDAHSAEGDVRAAMRLAWKLGRHEMFVDWDLERLHEVQVEAYRQQRLSFNAYRQKQGKQPDDDNLVWPVKPYASNLGGEL